MLLCLEPKIIYDSVHPVLVAVNVCNLISLLDREKYFTVPVSIINNNKKEIISLPVEIRVDNLTLFHGLSCKTKYERKHYLAVVHEGKF